MNDIVPGNDKTGWMKVWHYSLFFCFHKTDKRKDKKKETFSTFFQTARQVLDVYDGN